MVPSVSLARVGSTSIETRPSADYARIYQEYGVTAEAVVSAAHDSILAASV